MAFNWQTFRTRALTAVIFAVIMIAGLFWNAWSFYILFSLIHFGCWWEYDWSDAAAEYLAVYRSLKPQAA